MDAAFAPAVVTSEPASSCSSAQPHAPAALGTTTITTAPTAFTTASPSGGLNGTDEYVDNVLDRLGVRHVDEDVVACEVIQKAQARWASIAAAKRARRPPPPPPPPAPAASKIRGTGTPELAEDDVPASDAVAVVTVASTVPVWRKKKKGGRKSEAEEEEEDGGAVSGDESDKKKAKAKDGRRKEGMMNEMLGESNQVRFGDLTPFEEQRLAAEQKSERHKNRLQQQEEEAKRIGGGGEGGGGGGGSTLSGDGGAIPKIKKERLLSLPLPSSSSTAAAAAAAKGGDGADDEGGGQQRQWENDVSKKKRTYMKPQQQKGDEYSPGEAEEAAEAAPAAEASSTAATAPVTASIMHPAESDAKRNQKRKKQAFPRGHGPKLSSATSSCRRARSSSSSSNDMAIVMDDNKKKGTDKEGEEEGEPTVSCPVCGRGVPVQDKTQPDAELSQHLDRCMRTSRRRASAAYKDEEDEEDKEGYKKKKVNKEEIKESKEGVRKEVMDFVDVESSDEEEEEEEEEEGKEDDDDLKTEAPLSLRLPTGQRKAVTAAAVKDGKGKKKEKQMIGGKQKARGFLLVDDFADDDYEHRLDEYEAALRAMGGSSGDEEEEEEEEEDEVEGKDEGSGTGGAGGGGSIAREPIPGSRAAQATARREGMMEGETAGPLELPGGFKLPARINRKLYWYQRTGVRWLWELYRQGAGGILGDEMGLGKTVQVSAFLGGLQRSGRLRGGGLIVAPATLMSQWASELYAWAPWLRVVLLHRSAAAFAAQPAYKVGRFVRKVLEMANGGGQGRRGGGGVVCLTTYESLKLLRKELLGHAWAYVALDEGQKIRNPDAEITVCAKQLPTVHRLILSGTPIQNNLKELWSLFDFCFPGRLGTLPAFETELATPIRLGGFSNASPSQAQCAYRCALVLRDLIHPYLLRRMKKDIMTILPMPKKTEQVLFCKLTARQRALYRAAISSPEIRLILEGKASHFKAITVLRKICNHADLVAGPNEEGVDLMSRIVAGGGWADEWHESDDEDDDEDGVDEAARMVMPRAAKGALKPVTAADYGDVARSGKLQVLAEVLPRWEKQGHRVLLFSQTRQMLDILERLVKRQGWGYLRMDGNTNVGARPAMIERFNTDENIFIFLLTTRTGGLGISLTGANRVVLFDPDWNPQTDIQARERAWRLGQKRAVTIYRLVTTGTIEEKIYQRQIFKTAISNRVLVDPKQKRLFSSGELKELFTLKEDFGGGGGGQRDGGRVDEEAPNDTAMEFMEGVVRRSDLKKRGERKWEKKKEGEKKEKRREEEEREGELREDDDEGSVGVPVEYEEEQEQEQGQQQDEEDSKILRAVFEGRGLSSILSHDVVESGKRNTEMWVQMQEHAKRIADRAAAALQDSAALVLATQQQQQQQQQQQRGGGVSSFTPTWTGRSGSAGLGGAMAAATEAAAAAAFVSSLPRFGPRGRIMDAGASGGGGGGGESGVMFGGQSNAPISSTDILSRFREREGGSGRGGGGLVMAGAEARYMSLMDRIKKFLMEKGPRVPTERLLQYFRDVPHTDAVIFKAMLKTVGRLENGAWSLREEEEEGGGGEGEDGGGRRPEGFVCMSYRQLVKR